MESTLSAEHPCRDYGGRGSVIHAMGDVSFSMERGEFVGIMGVSGSGKSTLLNYIATIDTLTVGYIQVEGQDVAALKGRSLPRFRRERPGFVFQDCNLLDILTALENTALALTIRGTPAGEIGGRVKETAELFGITDCLDKHPYQMPGGQRQWTVAAWVIITDPALVLANEATDALDSRSAKLLLNRFEVFNRGGRATILMVTHDAFTASYCHCTLFLQDGAVLTQLERGGQGRRVLFQQIIGVVTRLGGDQSDAL